jgi:hypothetical protein
MYFGLKVVVMVRVPLFEKFVPAESLHPVGGSGQELRFRLSFALPKTLSPDEYYSTPTLHECLVLMEPKHRNRGI